MGRPEEITRGWGRRLEDHNLSGLATTSNMTTGTPTKPGLAAAEAPGDIDEADALMLEVYDIIVNYIALPLVAILVGIAIWRIFQ